MAFGNWLTALTNRLSESRERRRLAEARRSRRNRRQQHRNRIESLEDRALLSGTPYTDTWAPEIETTSISWPAGNEGAGYYDPVTFDYIAPKLEFTVTDKSPWGGGFLSVFVDWGDSTGTPTWAEATLSATGMFTDTDGNIISSYHASITHEWGDQGPWSISFKVRDDWGNEDSAAGTATLINVEPTGCLGTGCSTSVTGTGTTTWGTTTGTSTSPSSSVWATLTVGDTFSISAWANDTAWDDQLTVDIDWGGAGSIPQETTTSGAVVPGPSSINGTGSANGTLKWQYSNAGKFTVSLKVKDDDMAAFPADAADTLLVMVLPKTQSDQYVAVDRADLIIDAAQGVKANDTPTPLFTVELVADATHGSVILAADGSFTYTPSAGAAVVDTFTYRLTDGTRATAVETVTIDVGSLQLIRRVYGSIVGGYVPFIEPGAAEITDTTVHLWTGEYVLLTAFVEDPSNSNTTFQATGGDWTIPGSVIKEYERKYHSGSVTYLTASDRTGVNDVAFHWIDALAYKDVDVEVDVAIDTDGDGVVDKTLNDVPVSATFHVQKPSVWVSAQTQTVSVNNDDPSRTTVRFDSIDFRIHGPTIPAGQYAWFQKVVSSTSYRDNVDGTQEIRAIVDAADHGDVDDPFVALANVGSKLHHDNPQEPLFRVDENGNLTELFDWYTRTDTFATYAMWISNESGAIPVPLVVVPWFWTFNALSSDGGASWSVTSSHSQFNGTSVGTVTSALPTWTENVAYVKEDWQNVAP